MLQCYINAGLLLRALGEDDIAPFLNFLRHTHDGEPKVAFAICFVFTTGLSMIGSIDFLAIAMSIMFLLMCEPMYLFLAECSRRRHTQIMYLRLFVC